MNKKVLQKMHDKGLVTLQELNDGVVSNERYDMFVAGVDLIDGVVLKPQEHLEAYSDLIDDPTQDQTHVKGQIRRLEKLLKRKEYADKKDLYGGEGVIRFKRTKAKSQKKEVLRHLKDEGSITSWEAFMEYGITRLTAIIWILRHEEGLDIETKNITKRNRYDNVVNYAKYSLNENPSK